MTESRRILIVAPAWVGDLVMADTLLQRLAQRVPAPELHLLAPPATAPLASRLSAAAAVHRLDVGHGVFGLGARRAVAGRLADLAFDQAIVLPNSWKSALVPWLARIPLRTGWIGEARYGLLNDHRRLDADRYPLMIERFMALGLPPGAELGEPYPVPRLAVDGDRRAELLTGLGLDGQGAVLALCPGAEYGEAKRWPAAHYAAVARDALARGGRVWVFGSAAEAALGDAIAARAPGTINLAGRTSLADAVDLLSAADRVVSNDSGLMHVACAVGVPVVVAVYGSTTPAFTPPLGGRARALSLQLAGSPCFKRTSPLGHLRCLRELQPDRVIEALWCGS
ncbi:MAG: lipopolysaccharide heptosyltransferase II [Pseudomonadales bacterium]